MNIAGFGNLVACYCAFDYRWRPVARDEGDPPFSWSLSFVLGIRGSNRGSYMLLPQFGSCLLAEHAPRVRESMFLPTHPRLIILVRDL